MKQIMHSCVMAIAVLGLCGLLTGCDREVSHTEKTKVKSDGTVENKETTVKQAPDGTVTKEESERKSTPATP